MGRGGAGTLAGAEFCSLGVEAGAAGGEKG